MANRRMFSLDVVGTDSFMEMPLTAQALYFHLGMRADDDGFVSSPKQIIKTVECKQDDIKILVSKGFAIPFETGVIVIRHWNQNNNIRADRYKETRFLAEKSTLALENGIYNFLDVGIPDDNQTATNGIPDDNQRYTQYRLGKGSIGKGSIVKSSVDKDGAELKQPAPNLSGILLPLNDNTLYDVPLDKIDTWQQAYPAVDVKQELQKMRAWLESNPPRRKTGRGICRFINVWLSKEQDKGGIYRNGGSRQQETAPVNNDLPPEYQEMYKKYLGKNPPDPDAPFQ